MAIFNEPQKWAQTLGKDADVTTIPDTAGDTDPSIDKIFPAVFSIPLAHGGKAIPRSVLNGLFKLLGDWSFYQQNGGIASYSNTFDYVAGRVVLYNGNLYKCIHTNGASSTVVTPDSNTAYWQRLDNFVRSVNSVNADDNGNVSITSVNHATSADSATKATNDSSNRNIVNTYALKSNYPDRIKFAFNTTFKDYVNVTVDETTWGLITTYNIGSQSVNHATSADNATTATNATNLGGYPASDYIRKNGNDYYDNSDITSLIYAGNGAGTIRNEIANGNFARVHPGQTIKGKVTGTTYIVVGCNIYLHRGDTELTTNHIGLMPIQLIGNDGNLLWSGKTYAGSSSYNTVQGDAPWASDNETEGKNQTSCYRDSYIAKTVLPKVDNLWLKPDFEDQGISILTFRNLEAISFDTNATCMSNPNWRGCATDWSGVVWNSRRLVLPSEPEIYGHYHWSGSPWESGSQHTQLPLYRHKEIHKVYPRAEIWLKDSASASRACSVSAEGAAVCDNASYVLRVCPLFLIA